MTSIRKAQDIKVLKNGTAGQAALKVQYISGSTKVEKRHRSKDRCLFCSEITMYEFMNGKDFDALSFT